MASSCKDESSQHIVAENRSSGSQFIADGHGDQNVVNANGFLYSDRSVTVNISGIPSVWDLAQNFGNGNAANPPLRGVITKWLMGREQSTVDTRHRHLQILTEMTPGTGSWLLEKEEFEVWKDPRDQIQSLLLHGILGCGKTMLVARIIESLKETSKDRPDIACIYYYFRPDDTSSPSRVWASLLEQLLLIENPGGIAKELIASFNNSLHGSSPLHYSEYFGLFQAQASMFTQVYLVVDDLDMCPRYEGPHEFSLRDALGRMPHTVKLLFTSKYDTLQCGFPMTGSISVEPAADDVDTYIKARIERHARLDKILEEGSERQTVIEKVLASVLDSGMFLLARLHLDNLDKQGTLAGVKKALAQLPADSSSAFESSVSQIINNAGEFEGELAKQALTWVVHSKTGLTVKQIEDGFALRRRGGKYPLESNPSAEQIISSCVGLLIIDSKEHTLRLVHESVLSHLMKHKMIQPQAELEMAKACLTCLLANEDEDVLKSPFFPYAAKYVVAHLGTDMDSLDSETVQLLRQLFGSQARITRAFKAIPETLSLNTNAMTGLHAAVYYDAESLTEFVLDAQMVDVNAQCSYRQTALHWAVRLGRLRLLKCLTRKNADPNIRDRSGDAPLHKALMGPVKDGVEMVEVLVHAGAKIDVPGSRGLTPLASAIRYGSTPIAKILVRSQQDVNVEVTNGWTSLREVFNHGHEIMNNLDSPSTAGWSPLRNAVRSHADYLIDVLLERGVDLNRPTSEEGWLPLIHIVKSGNDRILRHLLTRQPNPADPNIRDPKEGKTPLRWAWYYNRFSMVRILIEHGANVNEKNDDGWSPLVQAVKDANHDLVWLLIKSHADPNVLDGDNYSALSHAVSIPNNDIVWLLVTNGANIGINDNEPLAVALETNDLSVAWLLCSYGADVDAPDAGGTRELHKASQNGNAQIVQFLLSQGAKTSYKDDKGFLPLHYAVLGQFDEVTALLASRAPRRKELDTKDSHGNSPLILATLRESTSTIQILLRNGASCHVQDLEGLTALHHAARLGFNDGIQVMLDEMEDVDLADNYGYTALHRAVESPNANETTISILAQGGADLDAQKHDEITPLMLAVYLGNISLTRQLLREGVDINVRNSKGWTAMSLLNRETHGDLGKLLDRSYREVEDAGKRRR